MLDMEIAISVYQEAMLAEREESQENIRTAVQNRRSRADWLELRNTLLRAARFFGIGCRDSFTLVSVATSNAPKA